MQNRQLWRKAFWADFGIDIRRFGRDGRARARVGLRTFWLLYLIGYLGGISYVTYSTHDAGTYFLVSIGISLGSIPFIFRHFVDRREARESEAFDRTIVPPETAKRLALVAHGLSCMLLRSLSELWFRGNILPETMESIARRRSLDAARKSGAYDLLPRPARLLLMQPEQSWPEDTAASIFQWLDSLSAIAWSLYLTDGLIELSGYTSRWRDLESVYTRLGAEESFFLRPPWDLRVERGKAHEYFVRTHIEAVHRGLADVESDEERDAVQDWRVNLGFHPERERYLGSSTIAELSDDELLGARLAAARRFVCLQAVLEIADGKATEERLLELFFGNLEPPAAEAGA